MRDNDGRRLDHKTLEQLRIRAVDQAVARWRAEEYPAIREQAAKVGATIYFADEGGGRSDDHAGPPGHRSAAPRWWSPRASGSGSTASRP